MNQNPEVSFIICTYNRAGYLEDTLSSLLEFGSSDFEYEIVVIDNNSTDDTARIAHKYRTIASNEGKELNYFKEEKQGLSHARNLGIRESRSQYVVFFDDDIRATKSLIPSWCSFFRQHPNTAAAGGKIHVQFDTPRPTWMSHFLLPLLGHHDLGNRQKEYPPNKYPFGGNMGFNKSVFDRVGLFDTDLGRKGKQLNAAEEKELFQRIRRHALPIIYLPDALLFHRVGQDRLTIDFIRKQAQGLGSSMKLQLIEAPLSAHLKNWLLELGKLIATFPIGLGYLLSLQGAKAKLLFRFRYWIWKGYQEGS